MIGNQTVTKAADVNVLLIEMFAGHSAIISIFNMWLGCVTIYQHRFEIILYSSHNNLWNSYMRSCYTKFPSILRIRILGILV